MNIDSSDFRVKPRENLKIGDRPTSVKPICKSRKQYKKRIGKHADELAALQPIHYASGRYALLLIFQGMDAAGKDGAIRHVLSGVNPEVARSTVSNSPARRS